MPVGTDRLVPRVSALRGQAGEEVDDPRSRGGDRREHRGRVCRGMRAADACQGVRMSRES